jgi:hypothetical protein
MLAPLRHAAENQDAGGDDRDGAGDAAGSARGGSQPLPSERDITAALERVLKANGFVRSERLKAFLNYIVAQALAGRQDRIKGYAVAVEALGHSEDHDPQTDPTVRVLACRMRQALELYYSGQGAGDPVRIEVPKGGYVPLFALRTETGGANLSPARAGAASNVLLGARAQDLLGPRKVVFDQISTMAVHLTAAASAMVTLCDDSTITVLGSHGMTALRYAPTFSLRSRLDEIMPVVVVDDVAADLRLRDHPIRSIRPAVKRLIFVPAQLDSDRRGALVVFDQGVDFTLTTRHGTLLCDLVALAAQEIETLALLRPPGSGSPAGNV